MSNEHLEGLADEDWFVDKAIIGKFVVYANRECRVLSIPRYGFLEVTIPAELGWPSIGGVVRIQDVTLGKGIVDWDTVVKSSFSLEERCEKLEKSLAMLRLQYLNLQGDHSRLERQVEELTKQLNQPSAP